MDARWWRQAVLLASAALFTAGQVLWVAWLLAVVLIWEVASGEPVWQPTSLDRPVLIMIAVLLLSALGSPWRAVALRSVAEFAAGILIVVRAVVLCVLHRRDFTRRFLVSWAAGGAVAGLAAVASSLLAPDGRAMLPQHGPTLLGTTLAAAMLVLLGLSTVASRPWRFAATAGTAATVAGLAVTWSRGAWASAVVGLAVLSRLPMVARTAGRVALPALLIAGVFMSASPEWHGIGYRVRVTLDTNNALSRPTIWRVVPRIVADHPALGTGLSTFVLAYAEYTPPPQLPGFPPHAHNLYLTFAAETGLIGLAALVALLWAGASAIWRWHAASGPGTAARVDSGVAFAALIAVLAHQMVDATLLGSSVAFGLYALLGLGAAEDVARKSR